MLQTLDNHSARAADKESLRVGNPEYVPSIRRDSYL